VLQIILFAPLLGALIAGFLHRIIGEAAATWTATGLLFLSAALSWVVFLTFDGVTQQIPLLTFIESGRLAVDWAIRLDRLTAIMLVVVGTVSALVHLYSHGYMAHDDNFRDGESYRPRFFAYLSLFTFAMLLLVTADNLVQLFVGWEGVGLASYLLIGFYYRKPSANAAAIKAFIVNRVGDFGFMLGMAALFFVTQSLDFDTVFAEAPALAETRVTFLGMAPTAANLIGLLLFLGAMGKSAQLFLHTWLPDAMEGPTPVSALIHAATMVTAGVFLVCRMSPIYEFAPVALMAVLVVGTATAVMAATIGLVQSDIKRVIAWSTCSQLGYMFAAAGAGVYSAAMFHLFTHAFFKALLFLGAGSVIHAMHHEQEMPNYGGLRKKLPWTFAAMLIGTLAITGVGIPLTHIGFAGFLSKDAVIESVFAGDPEWTFWAILGAASLTSFYSWRLIFLTFFGAPRGNPTTHDHAHESPWTMLVPLGVLSLGAIFSGMIWYNSFFGKTDEVARFFGIPYVAASEAPGDDHASDGHAAEPADVARRAEEAHDSHHGAFAGLPGEGALYIAPDNTTLDDAHNVPKWVKVAPFGAMSTGLLVAILFYLIAPGLPARLAGATRPVYLFLYNRWYFDALYDAVFIRGARGLGRLFWKRGDGAVIDGAINGVAMGVVPAVTRAAGRMQSGLLYTYAFTMVLGVVLLLGWVMWRAAL
jgi:NADH-quinone oxidoreductase subunit L